MAEPFWATRFRGQPIRLELNDLSNQRLREAKSRFGPEYGIPTAFIEMLLRGDMDAIAVAVWIGQQKAGGNVEDLLALDFTLDDFEPLEDPKPKSKGGKDKARPTKAGTTTDDSVETQSQTETDTSSTSETSSE